MRKVKDFVKERLSTLSIGKKLIISGYLIMMPIILCMGIVLTVRNYYSMEHSARTQALQNIRSINEGIQLLCGEMEDICVYISVNETIKRMLSASVADVDELNMDSQVWVNRAPMKMVEDMAALKGSVKTIAIYPENGLRPYLRCLDAASHISTLTELRRSDIYQKAINKRGKMVWTSAGKYERVLYQQNRKDKVVLYREIYNLARTRKLAFLAIGADKEYFENLCAAGIDMEKAGIAVLSMDGEILIETGCISKEAREFLGGEEYQRNGDNFFYCDGSMIYRGKNEANGMSVCQITQAPSLKVSIAKALSEPAVLAVGFLAGLFPILLMISRVVTVPLKKLQEGMNQFKKGDFNQKLTVAAHDEVGQAMDCFNDMVDEIRELVNRNYIMALKEKESELAALQAQINPHFLYNTLDALYWQAQNMDNEDLAEDILALSNLFRMVLSQGKGIISVQEEIALITEYLHVQKMRFERKMDYEIQVDEEIGEYEIPKLVLQPFVENAIVHGFEKQMDCCKITVSGCKEDKYLKFVIKDTGIGMSQEQIANIFTEDVQKRYSGQRVGRYAVKNVKERLQLKYHDDFVLAIESREGKGTAVTIKIPCEGGEE